MKLELLVTSKGRIVVDQNNEFCDTTAFFGIFRETNIKHVNIS